MRLTVGLRRCTRFPLQQNTPYSGANRSVRNLATSAGGSTPEVSSTSGLKTQEDTIKESPTQTQTGATEPLEPLDDAEDRHQPLSTPAIQVPSREKQKYNREDVRDVAPTGSSGSRILSRNEGQQSSSASRDTTRIHRTNSRMEVRFSEPERPWTAQKHILALIDGDGYVFPPHLIAQGRQGGMTAASMLADAIWKEFDRRTDYRLSVYLCLGKEGLFSSPLGRSIAVAIARLNDKPQPSDRGRPVPVERWREARKCFDNFLYGFQGPHSNFVIDVGPGKERADAKIRSLFSNHIRLPETDCIILGVAHDNGYAALLEEEIIPIFKRKIKILTGHSPVVPGIKELNFPLLTIPNMFVNADSKPPSHSVPSPEDESPLPSELEVVDPAPPKTLSDDHRLDISTETQAQGSEKSTELTKGDNDQQVVSHKLEQATLEDFLGEPATRKDNTQRGENPEDAKLAKRVKDMWKKAKARYKTEYLEWEWERDRLVAAGKSRRHWPKAPTKPKLSDIETVLASTHRSGVHPSRTYDY